ncbi:hypothetical protein COCOBI_11-1660 [Coccomyxa sp. Obi]|nr:hypothetical protein COCOBI_11-1660 [Coccomyxa sp. Obi]
MLGDVWLWGVCVCQGRAITVHGNVCRWVSGGLHPAAGRHQAGICGCGVTLHRAVWSRRRRRDIYIHVRWSVGKRAEDLCSWRWIAVHRGSGLRVSRCVEGRALRACPSGCCAAKSCAISAWGKLERTRASSSCSCVLAGGLDEGAASHATRERALAARCL